MLVLNLIFRISHVRARFPSLRGVSGEELEVMRMNKVVQRGAFEKNLFLVNTSEDE
jgi:predicted house-cleaning noncanonical NTP pyrophosphatase (MazG superfamily)